MMNDISHKSGFTLLELIVVLMLISLMVGLTSIRFADSLPSARMQSAARDLASALRQTRNCARLNLEPKAVVLDLNARLYQLADGTVRSIPDGIRVKVVDTTATEIVEGKHAFTFQPAGVTECDSIILWNDKKSIRMQIDPVVGTVETKVAGN